MPTTVNYAPFKHPYIDLQTGKVTKPWQLYLTPAYTLLDQMVAAGGAGSGEIATLRDLFGVQHDVDTGVHRAITADSLAGQVTRSPASDHAVPILDLKTGFEMQSGPWLFAGNDPTTGATLLVTTFAAQEHNYAPAGIDRAIILQVQVATTGVRVTGLETGWGRYRLLLLVNYNTNVAPTGDITLAHDDAASDAHNRFYFPNAQDFVLAPQQSLLLICRSSGSTELQGWAPVGAVNPAAGSFASDFVGYHVGRQFFGSRASGASTTVIRGLAANTLTILSASDAAVNDNDATGNYVRVGGVGSGSGGFVHGSATDGCQAQQDPTWDVILKTGADLAECRIWIVLSSTGVLANADTGGGHYMGFRYSTVAGDAGWVGVTRDGTTQAVTAAVASIAVSTRYRLRVRKSGSTAYFSVNGGTEVSQTSNLPGASTDLYRALSIFGTNGGSAAPKRISWGQDLVQNGVN